MLKRPHAPLLLALVATMLAACAGRGPTDALTPVPITDFKMVAGNWEGPVSGISAQHDDWVELTITPDGKYDFGVYRTIGVFGGTGTLKLSGGTVQLFGERGSATYTLYQSGAKRILQVQAVLSDGRQLSATLSPKK
jgi:hypothetical protein